MKRKKTVTIIAVKLEGLQFSVSGARGKLQGSVLLLLIIVTNAKTERSSMYVDYTNTAW